MNRRQIMKYAKTSIVSGFALGLVSASLALVSAPSQAKEFPAQPIQLVVGYGAGGGTDMCFRALAMTASKSLGQSIVIENKPGAGSSLSIGYISRQKPDG